MIYPNTYTPEGDIVTEAVCPLSGHAVTWTPVLDQVQCDVYPRCPWRGLNAAESGIVEAKGLHA